MFKYASAIFYTGISETVVVVGVQRLFVWCVVLAQLFATAMELQRNEDSNVLYALVHTTQKV